MENNKYGIGNREIKFRVWESGRMESDMLNIEMSCYPEMGYNNLDDYFENDEWVIMQYTGLKDKNGREIYEGDIVFDGKHSGVVGFEDGYFHANSEPIGERKMRMNVLHSPEFIKVIGNVFENPELLTNIK